MNRVQVLVKQMLIHITMNRVQVLVKQMLDSYYNE